MKPYDTDFMRFDADTNRYYITEAALVSHGIDLRGRLAASSVAAPEFIVNGLLSDTTDMLYAYIHQFNVDNEFQDKLIAEVPSMRKVIYSALLHQAVYVVKNGNLTLSIDDNERQKAIDMTAISELNRIIPELGVSILHQGRWNKCVTY